jgi:hypothetical protein
VAGRVLTMQKKWMAEGRAEIIFPLEKDGDIKVLPPADTFSRDVYDIAPASLALTLSGHRPETRPAFIEKMKRRLTKRTSDDTKRSVFPLLLHQPVTNRKMPIFAATLF